MASNFNEVFPSLGDHIMTERFIKAWQLQATTDIDPDVLTAPEVLRHFYDDLGYDERRVVCISANALDVVLDEIGTGDFEI